MWHGIGAFGAPQLLQSYTHVRHMCKSGRLIRNLQEKFNLNLDVPLQLNLAPDAVWVHPVHRNIDASMGCGADFGDLARMGIENRASHTNSISIRSLTRLVNPLEYAAMRVFRLTRQLHITRLAWTRLGTRNFMDYFKGFEKVEAVKQIFGEKTEEVLRNLKVEFIWFGYMGVDGRDGHLMVNEKYFSNGDRTDIYLDVVHELCHVKQWMDGKELFDERYDYVDRPTEVDAYRYTVQEAIRIGLTDDQILCYLQTEWLSNEDLQRLVKNMGIDLKRSN